MTTKQQLVVGVFRDHAQVEQAIHELLQAGFAHHQIHFAGRGSATGGILEKIKSLFTGEDMSVGGIYDDLVNMGAPPEDARYYQSEFEAGRTIIAVQGPGDVQKAFNILVRHGGYGANQRFAQSAGSGTSAGVQGPTTAPGVQRPTTAPGVQGPATAPGVQGPATAPGVQKPTTAPGVQGPTAAPGVQKPTTAAGVQGPTAAPGVQGPTTEEQRSKLREEEQRAKLREEEQRIKLREEELRARKKSVEKGEAVLHKDVIAEEKSIDVPVTREEVYVERRPGSGQPSDQPISEGETYRIPIHEEQVTIEKVPVEREEVVFGKQPIQETQRVSDTVQREEAYIEHAGDINIRDRDLEQERDLEQGRGSRQGRDLKQERGSRQGRDFRRDRDFERGENIEDQPTP